MKSRSDDEQPLPLRSCTPTREITLFVLIAFGLAWCIYLPALFSGATPEDPLYGVSASLYMFTPGIAALLVSYFVWRPRSVLRATGLTPLRPIRRVGGYSVLALLILPAIGLIATLLAAVLDVIRLDLTGYSGFREALTERAPSLVDLLPDSGFPLAALLAGVGVVAVSIFPIAFVTCLGEELGWRGYLLPRLLPFGVWPALLVSGFVHGLWHAPQLVIQSTAGGQDPVRILIFLAFCIVIGILLGWLRLASGSVWPAVIGHASNNSFAILGFLLLSDAESPTSQIFYAGTTGGIIGMAVTMTILLPLALTGHIRVRSFEPSHPVSEPYRALKRLARHSSAAQ